LNNFGVRQQKISPVVDGLPTYSTELYKISEIERVK